MKSKQKKILATILCMVMVLTNNFSILAEETENPPTEPVTKNEAPATDTEISETAAVGQQETPKQPEETPETEVTPEEPKEEDVPETKVTSETPEVETTSETSEVLEELKYEDEQVSVVVTATEEGAIPAGATLKVLPITLENNETKTQYEDVEKRIQEKVAEEEKEVLGFLAYDITFVDSEGNQVEPNGKVKVSMDYKNAVLPQEVVEKEATDAEVTVLHLEEDEKGEVKQVVDMSAEKKATVDTLTTTEGAKIQNMEVETESFSVFTITWNSYYKISVKYVDENGRELSHEDFQTKNLSKNLGNEVKLSDYAPSSVEIDRKTYAYQRARINTLNGNEAKRVRVRRSDGRTRYEYNAQEKDGDWKTFNTENNKRTVLLVYAIVEPLTTVDTVDASSQGVTMKMIDLGGGKTNLKNGNTIVDFGENSGYGKGNIKYGLLKSRITDYDGFPTVKSDGNSLGRLFRGAREVDHLFRKDIYDDTGYFEYSSFENYAYLNGNEFTVYDQIGTPSDENAYFYQRGNFMPYNKIENGKFSVNRNLYNEDGEKLSTSDPRYKENLYKTQGTNNFQFGMLVEAEFTQQRDGQATHQRPDGEFVKSDMIYEFNGDDDLWVFIDNVLVLDIGGVHDAHSGSINFRTGDVIWYDCETNETPVKRSTTLKELFRKANVLPSGKPWTEAGAKKEFKGDTFADYTTDHSFKMYYFERGAGASNLHVKFNLPTVPTNSVNVQKVVQNEVGQDANYAKDIDFLFQIDVDGNPYANQPYDIVVGNTVVGNGTTDEKAQFTLKHNQTARFKEISGDKNYRVKELGAYLDGYEVELDGTTIWTPSDGTKIPQADSGQLNVAEKSTVVFINKMVRSSTLNIKKELAEGTDETDKEFQIELKLGDELYKGTYTIGNTTFTATNGIIKLKAGQTATITGLPYGVSFEARELMDGSYLPTYGITGKDVVNIQIPEIQEDGTSNGITSASAQINGENCTLTVTNKEIPVGAGTTSVSVQKKWQDMAGVPIPEYVDVYLYKDENRNGEFDKDIDTPINYAPIRLSEENKWSGKWDNLPGDTDYVLKEVYPPGYEQVKTEYDNSFDSIAQVGGRNTPNNNVVFNIGVNNLLLVKETGNHYFLWSPIDLKLGKDDISYIAGEIQKLDLEGAGNLDLTNLSYCYGVGDFNNISLERLDNGWKLSFHGKSAWAMFWTFQYHRTQGITLTNSLDKDAYTSVRVEKEWRGDTPDTRPDSVTVQLYKNGIAEDAPVVLNSENNWKHTFENLPVYTVEGGKVTKNVYEVKETMIGNEKLDENGRAQGYQSSVTEIVDDKGIVTFIITNSKDWQIVKISHSSEQIKLEGAIFKLTKNNTEAPEPTWWGETDKNGVIKWYTNSIRKSPFDGTFEDGEYTLTEVRAPAGYIKSEETWTITIEGGIATDIVSSTGEEIKTDKLNGKDTYYFKNTPLYELPSAGGTGIFVYTIGGTLLLMAATLLLYKMKREEVLKS
mgnify:FL=1